MRNAWSKQTQIGPRHVSTNTERGGNKGKGRIRGKKEEGKKKGRIRKKE